VKIEKIPELFYDEEIWGAFIDSIAENAKVHKIKPKNFKVTFAAFKK